MATNPVNHPTDSAAQTLLAALDSDATSQKDLLTQALDSVALDEDADKGAEPPESEDDKPDENGLVYITRTFTVDPSKYISPSYRPAMNGKVKPPVNTAKMFPGAAWATSPNQGKTGVQETVEETENIEPTVSEEKDAAKDADAEKKEVLEEKVSVEEQPSPSNKKAQDKETKDEAIVFDYATSLDGTSFMCYDERMAIDYAHIAMDTAPRRPVTRETCQTTFAQCRAENPLFCRFHGPKLLEEDLKRAIRRHLSFDRAATGFSLSVTKDRNAQNPMTFRVTVGCRPEQRERVQHVLDNYLHRTPGISSQDSLHENDRGKLTQEFDMDIMRADQPPSRGHGNLDRAMAELRDERVASGRNMPVVGDTPEGRARRPRMAAAQRPAPQPAPPRDAPQPEPPTPAPQPSQEQQPPQEDIPPEQRTEAPRIATREDLDRIFADADQPPEFFPVEPEQETPPTQPPSPEPQQPAPAPRDDGIEHLEGGIKARFSPSEVQAIESEMGRAQRVSTENPNDAEARGYAHALSHFLGSANSRYGRQHNALAGIRDGITKAELLDKAQRRLESTADADNPARYNGSVRALEKIAELAGLHGLEIDGARVALAHPELDGAGERPAPESQQAQAQNPTPEPAQEQNQNARRPTDSEISDAAREIAESDMGRNNGISYAQARAVLVNRLDGRSNIGEGMLNQISGVLHDNHPVLRALRQRYEEQNRGENQHQTENTPTPPPSQAAQPAQEQDQEPINLSRENLEANVTMMATQLGLGPVTFTRMIERQITGQHQITPDELRQYDSILPEGNNLRRALHAAAEGRPLRVGANGIFTNRPEGTGNPVQQAPSPAAQPPTRPTAAQIEEAADVIARHIGSPGIREQVRQRIAEYALGGLDWGNATAQERDTIGVLPEDNPVRRFLERGNTTYGDGGAEPPPSEADAILPDELVQAMRNTPGGECSVDDLRRIQSSFNAFHINHPFSINLAAECVKKAVAPEVAAQDTATNASTVNAGRIRDFSPHNVTRAPSHGCNCWKTVATSILRMRGFNVTTRGMDEASPVFADTIASGGQQKLTFAVSQTAMAAAYEPFVGEEAIGRYSGARSTPENVPDPHWSGTYINNKLRNMARGYIDDNGNAHLPYPDGTVISCWNGGHCQGAVLYQGAWYTFNPWGGTGLTKKGDGFGRIANHFITTGGDTYEISRAIRDFRSRRQANPRFQYDPDNPAEASAKIACAQFLTMQAKIYRERFKAWQDGGSVGDRPTRESIPDEEVLERCSHDKEWMKYQNSYIILPTQPIIKEMFGLAKRRTVQ